MPRTLLLHPPRTCAAAAYQVSPEDSYSLWRGFCSAPPVATAVLSVEQAREGVLSSIRQPSELRALCSQAHTQVTANVALLERHYQRHAAGGDALSTGVGAAEAALEHRRVLKWVDSISNLLCLVVDASALLQHTHPRASWRQEASAVVEDLSSLMEALNGNEEIYGCLRLVQDEARADVRALLSEEELRTASWHIRSCESRGIHLPPAQRHALAELQNVERQLALEFSMNLYQPRDPLVLRAPASLSSLSGSDPRGFDDWVSRTLAATPAHLKGRMQLAALPGGERALLAPSDGDSCAALSAFVGDESVRRQVHLQQHGVDSAQTQQNEQVLLELLRTRTRLAQARGFSDHAAFALSQLMAAGVEEVEALVQAVHALVQPRAEQELALLRKTKREHNARMGLVGAPDTVLEWDRAFLMGALKAGRLDLDHADLRQFFSVHNVTRGLQLLSESLLGLQLVHVDPAEHEAWDGEVRKMELRDGARVLGVLYLDLFERPHKFNQAGTFVLQSRCNTQQGPEQTPVVALVMSLSDSGFLPHAECVTLLHEFGHCLHHLCSETDMQYLAGTRGEQDFIETPSTLLEHFGLDHAFLKTFAVSHRTGVVIDAGKVQRLRDSQSLFVALDTLDMLKNVMVDLRLAQHAWTDEDTVDEVRAVVQQTSERYGYTPSAPGTNWAARFGHLSSYGACYYSYLYGHTFSDALWRQWFAPSPDNNKHRLEAGRLCRKVVLKPGGARDPRAIMRDALLGPAAADVDVDVPALGVLYFQRKLDAAPTLD
jgi:Zn-dependent oligopeptidase